MKTNTKTKTRPERSISKLVYPMSFDGAK